MSNNVKSTVCKYYVSQLKRTKTRNTNQVKKACKEAIKDYIKRRFN